MIAVIFEVWPHAQHKQTYLDVAADLRPLLDGMEGFISIERFVSLADPNKILSLSFWRDEKALEGWRNLPQHRMAQKQGRDLVFRDYRLRVGGIDRDYGMAAREQAPHDSQQFHPAK